VPDRLGESGLEVVATPVNVGSGTATSLAQSYIWKDKYIGA